MTQNATSRLEGAIIFAVGLAVSVYAGLNLHLGSFIRPGPGGFPFILGGLLMLTGVLSVASSFFRGRDIAPSEVEEKLRVDRRVLAYVLVSIAAFALAIENLGLFPACFLIVLLSSGVVREMSLPQRLVSALLAAALAVLIFKTLLSVPVNMFNWG